VKTLAAIRTHRWGEDEERLLASLRPHFRDDVAVAYHDRPEEVTPPVPVADVSGEWLQANGFLAIKRWGWQCGDYFLYRLRDAFPSYERVWMIEPDVYFSSDPSAFFEACAAAPEDILGLRPGPRTGRGAFGDVGDLPRHRAIFALTRMSARAIDIMADLRRQYCSTPPGRMHFANDETFVYSNAVSRNDLTIGDLEDYAPDWFAGVRFDTDPDTLIDALSGEWHAPSKVYHPVLGRATFKAALMARFGNGIKWLAGMKASVDELSDEDIDDVARDMADLVRQRLLGVRNNRRLAAKLAQARGALASEETLEKAGGRK
jgi:hypothetical protein